MMRPFYWNKKGMNLMEITLVVVIAGIVVGLAIPNVRRGIENRQAKQATETARSIQHAVRMYQLDHDGAFPANLAALEAGGYLNSTEYAYKRKSGDSDSDGYEYSFVTTPKICAQAERYTITTTITPGPCHEECHERRGCDVCEWVCAPPIITKTKNIIGTIEVCE